jgi:hypothetical protein
VAQTHTVTAPTTDAAYTATFSTAPTPLAFVQVAASTPQSPASSVTTSYPQSQIAGDLDVVVVGWNDTTSTITGITDTAGNTYVMAAPLTRGAGVSQAIYYARNIAAGGNSVTVTFNQAAAYVDVRVAEYRGVDRTAPLDGVAAASGTGATASSGNLTTTARGFVIGAGTTTGGFTAASSGFTARIITMPDLDILEDRTTTAGGGYSATAAQSGAYVFQAVGFKAAAP